MEVRGTTSIPRGPVLRAVRLRSGLSLSEASLVTHVSKVSLSRYETGQRNADVLHVIADALGATSEEIRFFETGQIPWRLTSLGDVEDKLAYLEARVEWGLRDLDLGFLSLILVLDNWGDDEQAIRLRIRVIGRYVQWLGWWYRDSEAKMWAETTLNYVALYPDLDVWGRVFRAFVAETPNPVLLQQALTTIGDGISRGLLTRELAGAWLGSGSMARAAEALTTAESIRPVAEPIAIHQACCRSLRGSLYHRIGDLDQALAVIPDLDHLPPFLRFTLPKERSRVLVGLGRRTEARELLEGHALEADRHGWGHFSRGLNKEMLWIG